MKKLLAIILLVVFSFNSSTVAVSSAILKEYDVVHYLNVDSLRAKLYEFKLKLVIEAEEDGTWKTGSRYDVWVFMTVTYINYSHYDILEFGNATIWMCDKQMKKLEELQWSTRTAWGYFASPYVDDNVGEFSAIAPLTETRVYLFPSIRVGGGGYFITWGGADEVEPIILTVKTPPSPTMPSIYIATGIIIGLCVGFTGAYIIYRKRRIPEQVT